MDSETSCTIAASAILEGACLCGAHSFQVPADKITFGFASCHCSLCRRAHAAPFVMWSGLGAEHSTPEFFKVSSSEEASLTEYRSSPVCARMFCGRCGTHLYIKYDDASVSSSNWAGQVHFPTALLSAESLPHLERAMEAAGKPRYLHTFYTDRHGCFGDIHAWSTAAKYGGETGLEPIKE